MFPLISYFSIEILGKDDPSHISTTYLVFKVLGVVVLLMFCLLFFSLLFVCVNGEVVTWLFNPFLHILFVFSLGEDLADIK